jgi:predicted enzyme related to lactoylglutathione lyase
MKGSLLLFIVLGYIAVAVYSVGKSGHSTASRVTAFSATPMTLNRLTLATTKMAAMVQFYNQVFEAGLQPTNQYSASAPVFYEGNLAGVSLLLCPNEVAKVKTAQNRHQLRFAVSDLEEAIRRVQAAGGKVDGRIVEQAGEKLIAVRDPDGNTIEFVQSGK